MRKSPFQKHKNFPSYHSYSLRYFSCPGQKSLRSYGAAAQTIMCGAVTSHTNTPATEKMMRKACVLYSNSKPYWLNIEPELCQSKFTNQCLFNRHISGAISNPAVVSRCCYSNICYLKTTDCVQFFSKHVYSCNSNIMKWWSFFWKASCYALFSGFISTVLLTFLFFLVKWSLPAGLGGQRCLKCDVTQRRKCYLLVLKGEFPQTRGVHFSIYEQFNV